MLLLAGTFVAAIASGLAGFAFALIVSGIYLHVLEPAAATPLVLACSATAQVIGMLRLRGAMSWRGATPMLAGGLVGVPLGALLLSHVPPGPFRLAVGAFLVAYASYALLAGRRAAPLPRSAAVDAGIGAVGGVMGGLAGLSGAVPTLWVTMSVQGKEEQRAIYQPYIFVMQLYGLAWLGGAGFLGAIDPRLFLLVLPAVVAGTLVGLALYARVNDALFRRIVLVLLLASGLSLVA